jgi:AcrR family transcriptional regulator
MNEKEPPAALSEKQQRVLDAAMEIFAEKGYAGTSTADIAKKAGVAEGTVFKQYKTKKDLLIALVAPFFARTIAPVLLEDFLVVIRAPHTHVEDFLRSLWKNRLDFVKGHERVIRIAVQELPFHEEVRELAKKTIAARVVPDFEKAVMRLQAMGEIRAGNPRSIVRLIAGTFFSYFVVRMVLAPDARWDDDDELELMVSVLAKGLRP